MKPEQKFLIELKNSFKPIGGLWFKIPDAAAIQQVSKPYDVDYTLRGVAIGIEAKYKPHSSLSPDHIPNLLRPSQIDGLSRKYAAGGIALVVVQTCLKSATWYNITLDKKGMNVIPLGISTRSNCLWSIPQALLTLVEDTRYKNVGRFDDILDEVHSPGD
jgi:hypothetical protein